MLVLLILLLNSITLSYGRAYKFKKPIPASICDPKLQVKGYFRIYDDIHLDKMLLDDKHKIIMDWTPKAACSKSIEMFWNEMKIVRGIHYPQDGVVHDYRTHFKKACGAVTESMLNSSQYYKFKVVRNPYDRAVSSYLYMMKRKFAHTLLDKPGRPWEPINHPINDLSFVELLRHFIDKVRPRHEKGRVSRNIALAHFIPQSSKYEVEEFKKHKKSIFNRIVHVEKFNEDISRVNKDKKRKYSFPAGKDPHEQKKFSVPDIYLGNHNYSYLINNDLIPNNYGNFYNEETKLLVETIFASDLEIYGYEFPFHKVY